MQNKKASKILSIFSAAALLVTQLAVTLPASAANEDGANSFPGTTLIHDVSFDNGETIKVNKTSMNDTDATAVVTTEENAGADGSKAMKVVMNNPTDKDKRAVIWPGSCKMGDNLYFTKGVHYKYIVQFKYKVETGSSVIMEIGSGCANETSTDCGSLGVKGKEFMTQEGGDITKPGDWNLLYSPIYNEWTTVSLPLDMVAGSDQNYQTFAISLKQNAGKTATIYFDDIKLYRLDDQSANLGLVCFTTNGGKVLNPVGGVVGTEYTMPTPVKEGWEFEGWYTDEALTTPYDGKFPANSAKGGSGDSLVYTPLYAKWTFAPYVALYDDFESGNLITEATAGVSIQDGKGKNGGKALVFDLANKSGTMNLVPQDADGNRLAINAGESYKFIVTITYRMTEVNNLYAPIWMKHQLVNSGNGWLAGFAGNFHLGDVIWASRVPYSTYLGGYCGPTDDRGWHTVSYPISGTGTSSTGYLVHYFDGLGNKGELIIDDIKYTRVDNSSELSTVKLNANGGSTMDYITVLTGASTSELPTPTKEGYKFAGWYTDEACTAKCDTVPANNQSQTEDGKTTENVYANLYAKWIIDYYVALYDDFESGNLITEATAGVSIQDGKGKNGGKALVFDLANKSGTMNLVPQDADGNRLAINAGESYKFIVTITYRMTEVNNQYSPIWMKSQLVNSSNGWLSGFAGNFHLGDCIWASRVPYSTYLGGYCGPTDDRGWHTVSYPISGTGASSTGYLVHYFDGLGNKGELIIDDIKYTRVDNSSELSTVKLNANGGSTMDYITVLTGASTSELPTPAKSGYEFAGWYTDEACTAKCDTVPANNQSQTEDGKTTENVYVNLYAGWTAVSFDANGDGSINIIDLVSMKKSIANNEVKYNSDSLVELEQVLLSGIETVKATDKNNYVLTVHDEFDGTALNTALWNITANQNDVTLENGLAVFGKNGGAGSIDSGYKVEYKYGYVEARVKLPETSGVESAFWLNQNYAPTLRFSEIDIFETFGRSQVVSNIHKWDNNNKKDSYATTEEELAFHTDWNANVLTSADRLARVKSVNASAFHTVGCEWGEDFVRFYLDGEKYFEVNAEKYPDAIEIIKASPLYIVLSANPESATLTGTSADLMQVDYVRLYQNAAESTLIK